MNRREFTRLALAGLGMQAIPLIAGETGTSVPTPTGWRNAATGSASIGRHRPSLATAIHYHFSRPLTHSS